MDRLPIYGQIAEIGPKVVQRGASCEEWKRDDGNVHCLVAENGAKNLAKKKRT